MSRKKVQCSQLVLVLLLGATACASVPEGQTGPAADALARKIGAATGVAAWQATGAVRWSFAGRNHHIWDRERDFIQVKMGDIEVLRHLYSERGVVFDEGELVLDEKKRLRYLEKAYTTWVNDSFWLFPFAKFFDEGVSRKSVSTDGGDALLVTFSAGGTTPGDSYLWQLGENGRPTSWKMWVSILPIKGISVPWGGWTQSESGVWISTEHKTSIFTLKLENVATAENLQALLAGQADPFSVLDRQNQTPPRRYLE